MKLFEDLPSTNKPITAENLNQIQDNLVVVSPTEPTGDNREKVWVKKGKNLFNKDNFIVGMAINSSDGTLSSNTEFCFCGYIPVMPNTTYSRSVVGTNGNTFLDKNKNYLSTVEGTTFVTPDNCYYVGFNARMARYQDGSYETFMVNQGSSLLPYEEYIEPKIYMKNDNDVYEEFIDPKTLIQNGTITPIKDTIKLKAGLMTDYELSKVNGRTNLVLTIDYGDSIPNSATNIATIQNGFRPKIPIAFPIGLGVAGDNGWSMSQVGYGVIYPDGIICIRNMSGVACRYAFINVSYTSD